MQAAGWLSSRDPRATTQVAALPGTRDAPALAAWGALLCRVVLWWIFIAWWGAMSALADFSALDKLLNQPDDQPPLPNGGQPVAAAMGPGAIKAPMDTAIIPKPKGVEQARTEIWDEDDIAADDGLQIDPSDTRLRPEYDILYKQDVSANVRAASHRRRRCRRRAATASFVVGSLCQRR